MRFNNVCLESIAVALPDEVWTSAQIEEQLRPLYERLRLPFGRLELMTGIRERRMWPDGHAALRRERRRRAAPSSAVSAVRRGADRALHPRRGLPRHAGARVGLVRPPQDRPAGQSAQIFDLSNACLGFLNSIVVAAGHDRKRPDPRRADRRRRERPAAGRGDRPDPARAARSTATRSSRSSRT